ncbi:hypothetical protein [Arthrobacter glacialis]|uniref:DUF4190 domain-containing protein n=1 Tax=Arthrobacter glacialis TaxID=1664 RepID=A0A2S3ZST1_ARTGL|nr:hypothetical protein [Arthrobacter glacialis]POH72154.1 hypothetical protein CVS27_16805 [Arthrobacter glacialis]
MQEIQNPTTVKPVNKLAIAALTMTVVALVCLVLFGISIIVVFSVGLAHLAIQQIKVRGERGWWIAIASMSVGYIVATYALVSSVYYAIAFGSQSVGM